MRGTATARRRLSLVALAGAALVAMGALAACGLPPRPASEAPAAGEPPARQLTPAEAKDVTLQSWVSGQISAQMSRPPSDYRDLYAGPEVGAAQLTDQIRGQLGQRQDRAQPLHGVTVYVPRLSEYPLWFAAVVDTVQIDQDTDTVQSDPYRGLDVYVRTGPEARWRLAFDVEITGIALPSIELDRDGYVAPARGSLAVDLGSLPRTYVDYLESGGKTHGDVFAAGDVTDQLAWSVAHPFDASYSFSTDRFPRFLLPVGAGGAIGLFTVSFRIVQVALTGKCMVQDAKRDQQAIWVAPGRWKQVVVRGTSMRLAVIPPANAAAKKLSVYGIDPITGLEMTRC